MFIKRRSRQREREKARERESKIYHSDVAVR